MKTVMKTDIVLARLGTARTALMQAKTIQETKKIVDVAAAAEIYAKRQKLGEEAINYAFSIKVEALRQLGNMLKETERAGTKYSKGGGSKGSKREPLLDAPPTLASLGLDKKTSKLAQDIASLTDEQIESVKEGTIAIGQVQRRERRKSKMEEISRNNSPLDADKRYSVIYADPPWKYDFSFSDSRAIEEHYPTMEFEEIMSVPIKEFVSDDAILFLWCPPAFNKKAIAVLEAWGFEYRTNMVWVKPSIGAGQWVRQRHEMLLIGRRGDIPTPEGSDRPDSIVEAPRGRHSEKPKEFYRIIEKMYPGLLRIELFARNKQEGWDRWGNQA